MIFDEKDKQADNSFLKFSIFFLHFYSINEFSIYPVYKWTGKVYQPRIYEYKLGKIII